MIPIIVPFIPSSDRDHDRRRPTFVGILLSVIILSTGFFLAFFLLLTREISSPMPIIILIILFITFIMGIVAFTIVGTSVSSNESERRDNRTTHDISWDSDRSRRKREYCPECGSLVEFSDSYCTKCGSRLD